MFEIDSIMDPNLMYMILILFGLVVALIAFMYIFRKVRVAKIIFFILFLGGTFFTVYNYIDTNEKIIKNSYTDYIYGEIKMFSSTIRKAEVDSVATTFIRGGKGTTIVSIPYNCKIIDETENGEVIGIKHLNIGDTVKVYSTTNYSTGENQNEVEAYSIIRVKKKN